MLVPEQIFKHKDGRVLKIGMRMDENQAIGEIQLGLLSFGPLSVGVVVTEDGLYDAGFELQEPEPSPYPEYDPEA